MLLGYLSRTTPFTAVADDLYAKALALEDRTGRRALLVTMDLVGVQDAVTGAAVCRRIGQKTGLRREQILLNASHTHTGPLVSLDPDPRGNVGHPPFSAEEARHTVAYTRWLQDRLVDVAVRALADLRPARLSWGVGEVGFVMSRRLPTPSGVVMAANPKGLADRTVPVVRVEGADGKLRAVVFGCACHCTTLTGAFNVISGDYAGYAQRYLEGRHPGATALFLAGCGGDANPHPLGSMDLARAHGTALGREVDRVMRAGLRPVGGPLRTELARPELPLQEPSRENVEQFLPAPSMQSMTARHMLEILDAKKELPTAYPAPVAVWQFGRDLTLAALPAEPVAEYVVLLQKALGPDRLWVSGYNNDCFGYLPTAAVIRRGGHEAMGITLWAWGQSLATKVGIFDPKVEQVVVDAVKQLAARAGRPPAAGR